MATRSQTRFGRLALGAAPAPARLSGNPRRRRGTVSLQMLVILVPVLFGMMGFALDLGRLLLIRGELKAAANAAALAAAQHLIGTEASAEAAGTAAAYTAETATGFGNRYDFGGLALGETTGILSSTTPQVTYFGALADAAAEGESSGGEAGGVDARYARVEINAEAPLLFWGFLSLGAERKVPVYARAVAGRSAPLCTACGIEPMAVAALDASDAIDFGFVLNTKYTFAYLCNGNPPPSPLSGASQRVYYLVLNRLNEEATLFAEENQQLYRAGAQGLPGSATAARACFSVNAGEQLWTSVTPQACNTNRVATGVQSLLCGLASRFEHTVPAGCESIADVETMASAYQPDTDVADQQDYSAYLGNGRRVITIPIVDTLSAAGTMVVLGFRQFLVEPSSADALTINPGDSFGRFIGLYIGSVVPVKQGRFDGCTQTAGPGKVVLHQ